VRSMSDIRETLTSPPRARETERTATHVKSVASGCRQLVANFNVPSGNRTSFCTSENGMASVWVPYPRDPTKLDPDLINVRARRRSPRSLAGGAGYFSRAPYSFGDVSRRFTST
jgi:hypothetical protein